MRSCAQTVKIQVGGNPLLGIEKSLALRQQVSVLIDHRMAVPCQVGGRFALSGGRVWTASARWPSSRAGDLAGHAPAEDRDLARWSGLPLRDARAGIAAIATELRARADGLLELARPAAPGSGPARASASAPAELPAPRLLGAFDPVLHGWRSREPLIDVHHQRIVTVNGIFRPFALVKGARRRRGH